jgi:hypothetical protein
MVGKNGEMEKMRAAKPYPAQNAILPFVNVAKYNVQDSGKRPDTR